MRPGSLTSRFRLHSGNGRESRSDVESRAAKGRLFFLHVDAPDTRTPWSASDMPLEALDRLGLAFSERLDAPVDQVPDPTTHALAQASLPGKVPEADSLHATINEIPARDLHGREET